MKCTIVIRGSRKELVSQIVGVESPAIIMYVAQSMLIGKILRDLTTFEDLVNDEKVEVPTALISIMNIVTDLVDGNTNLSFRRACKVLMIQEV